MQNTHVAGPGKNLAVVFVAFLTVGIVGAQVQPRVNRDRIRNEGGGGAPLRKDLAGAADPLAKAAGGDPKADNMAAGTYHYTFRLHSFDGTALAASFYPSKLGTTAPVVLLVHEANRSRKDFEEPIAELKGEGLAGHLQEEGYAVFSMDLRGQGQNPRRVLTANERALLAKDLQAAYFFLIDRHNRGDFNIAKLGIIGLGEGANLAVAWAYQPGAAVSTEGRPSDLSALVLISPMPQGAGYVLGHVLPPLAPRIPLALLAGDKDNASKGTVESVRRVVERARLNKVEVFPTPLHGYKLLRLEPKVTGVITKFLDPAIKLRPTEWEPRYNLAPVAVTEIQTVRHIEPTEKPPATKDQAKANQQDNPRPGNARNP
jgi:alpha-beta hydrolase superfamily lysophospholipase